MKKLNESGVAHLLLIILVVGVIGFITYAVFKVHQDSVNKAHPKIASAQDAKKAEAEWTKDCSGKGMVTMSHKPMDLSDVNYIAPTGLLAGAHVTPIDHLYFYPKDMKNRDAAPVYAMADGYIVSYEQRSQSVDKGSAQQAEYRIVIQHNCSTFSYFDLMTSLDNSIKSKMKSGGLHVPVKAGQVLGRVGAQSLDSAIYNLDLTLPGFVKPQSYSSEFWKIHTDDFFKYWTNPNKSELLAKNIRKVEPYGGKIDYDIDGKLVGNWFQTGTNGYQGATGQNGQVAKDGKGYWNGHLSIAPDAVNVKQINISFGDYQGQATQFTAKTGSVDPATVGTSSGIVKYELVRYQQPNQDSNQYMGHGSDEQVQGVVLFELTADRSLKMEVFPGKTASQVNGFTSAAKTYER